jgi:hypothetical protein
MTMTNEDNDQEVWLLSQGHRTRIGKITPSLLIPIIHDLGKTRLLSPPACVNLSQSHIDCTLSTGGI